MWKKISLQLILLSLALFSIFFAYKTYFVSESEIEKKVQIPKQKNNEVNKIEVIKEVIEEEQKEIYWRDGTDKGPVPPKEREERRGK